MMHKLKMNAILADEMGLGKTIQIISFVSERKLYDDSLNVVFEDGN